MKSHPNHARRPNCHALLARGPKGESSTHSTRHGRTNPSHAPARPRPWRMSRRTLALADLKLAQLEDAFLDLLLDTHPRHETALDRLINDLAAADPADANDLARAALPEPNAAVAAVASRRIESALVAAVVQHHPRRDAAFDRLLCDLDLAGDASAPDAAHGAWVDEEERQRADFDLTCDNDFDGLG